VAWTTYIGIYIVVWWVVLFATLPIGVHSQEESGDIVPGTDPGAPTVPNLRAKLGWTTVISAVILLIFFVAYNGQFINLKKFSTLWGMTPY
jgi:predicted secreted protein